VNLQHKNYLALKQVIKNGKYEIKGDAVTQVAALFDWFDRLEKFIIDLDKPKIKKIDNGNNK
jgi:hypothetical protein